MRPVLLDVNGFASFREPTLVDFRDADYFALVGPTGSGKSTVIDALTFALYGSVPRWDNPRTVALALAPTVGRGVVRFVFDIGRSGAAGRSDAAPGGRYVVVRELRRAASGSVSVRSARLERLHDPSGTGAPEEETESLADGAAATTRAVEDLLGLPFADFTTCVVLPQGEFAEFLHTEPRKRQETLVRLLGLGVYDVIAKESNSEAKVAEQRAQVLTEQLGGYGDATAAAEQSAAGRVQELSRLRERVDTAVGAVDAVDATLADVEAVATALDGELRLLSGLAPPSGLAALTARHGGAVAASTGAAAEAFDAEAADTAAREALDAGPPRAALEQVGRDHTERAAVVDALPAARDRHAHARAAEGEAARAAGVAREAVESARAQRDVAAARLGELRETAGRLGAERDLLHGVVAPAGLDASSDRMAAAAAALAMAVDAVGQAEKLDEATRAALTTAPPRAPLERARRDRLELDVARAGLTRAAAVLGAARRAVATAAAGTAAAREHLDHARIRRAAGVQRDLAAALRPALTVGDACPVCAQRVAALPDRLPDGAVAEADRELVSAEAALDVARQVEAAATADLVGADHAVETVHAQIGRLTAALAGVAADAAVPGPDGRAAGADGVRPAPPPVRARPIADAAGVVQPGPAPVGGVPVVGPPVVTAPVVAAPVVTAPVVTAPVVTAPVVTGAAIEAALLRCDVLDVAARDAAAAARRARTDRDEADRAVADARRDTATATAALRATRDPLVPLGAPAVDDSGVALAWSTLVAWAGDAAVARTAALLTVGADVDRAAVAYAAVRAGFAASEQVADERRHAETAAARLEQDAAGTLDRLSRRDDELAAALSGAPDPSVVAAQLLGIAEREDAVRSAGARLRAARVALREADDAAAVVEGELRGAWDGLRAARDPLVALGAPVLRGDGIEAAWDGLVRWAAVEADDRSARLAEARSALVGHRGRRAELVARIVDDLDDHGVALPAPAATRRPTDPTVIRRLTDPTATRLLTGPAPGERSDPVQGPGVGVRPSVDVAAAPAAVATVLERARATHERIVERRAAAAALLDDRDRANENQQVARMVGQLLRSDGFPRWLVASALDTLVADASVSLAELSGGQFELAHDNGEFLVVDHADAGTRRPVKTLSGGETFQASLALALALSAQMPGLAAHGAARLESIFLDEGFGTLDAANLETVASTLEALAAHGDRVVGVVTHVPALAERVPVRYAVRRDQHGSTVTREDL